MIRAWKSVLLIFTAGVILASGSSVLARKKTKRPKTVPTIKLVKSLCDAPDKASAAAEALQKRKGAFARVVRFIKHGKCTVDKDAVLAFFNGQGEKGCKAIAGLITPKNKDWLPVVIRRYRALHGCPALRLSLYAALDFADEKQAKQILDFVAEDKIAAVGKHVFPWLKKGSEKVRIAAVKAIVNSGVKNGYAHLMSVYNGLLLSKTAQPAFRKALLAGMLKINPDSTLPVLINVLGNPVDGKTACGLAAKVPKKAAAQMSMALRMSRCSVGKPCPMEPVMNCLYTLGMPALPNVLGLFDVHRTHVRNFVVKFLEKWHSKDALEFLTGRYPNAPGPDRAAIVRILGRYNLKEKRIRDIVASAFNDGDAGVRKGALDVVTANNGTEFCPQIRDLAENDQKDQIKAAAVDTIYRLGCFGALPLLKRMVRYEKPVVRTHGLHALALMLTKGDLDFLYNLLSEGNQDVVKAAKRALILLTFKDPAKGRLKKLPAFRKYDKLKGRKLSLPGATARVSGDENTLIIVIGGGLDGRPTWVMPGLGDLTDDYTVALVNPDAVLTPTEAIVALIEKLKPKHAFVMGNGIWALDAARLQLSLPYQLQGAILVNPPFPTAAAMDAVSRGVMSRLPKEVSQAVAGLFKETGLLQPGPLNLYYAKLVAPALAPADKDPHKLWGMPSDCSRYNQAQTLLEQDIDPKALSQVKGLVVFSGAFVPKKQQDKFKDLKSLKVKRLDDCGYFVSPFCMDDMVDEINDFTGD